LILQQQQFLTGSSTESLPVYIATPCPPTPLSTPPKKSLNGKLTKPYSTVPKTTTIVRDIIIGDLCCGDLHQA